MAVHLPLGGPGLCVTKPLFLAFTGLGPWCSILAQVSPPSWGFSGCCSPGFSLGFPLFCSTLAPSDTSCTPRLQFQSPALCSSPDLSGLPPGYPMGLTNSTTTLNVSPSPVPPFGACRLHIPSHLDKTPASLGFLPSSSPLNHSHLPGLLYESPDWSTPL